MRTLRLAGTAGLAADCIEALSMPSPSAESIFPNLQKIALDKPSAAITPLLPHLTHPKVTTITFCGTGALGLGFNAFGGGCPSMTNVFVWDWTDIDALSSIVCHWKNLRHVHCGNIGFNTTALSHLSSLRNLRCMCFLAYDVVVNQLRAIRSPPRRLTFSALHDLKLRASFLTTIWRLLRLLHIPMLHDLGIGFFIHPTTPDLMSLFVALQEACTHTTLNRFVLYFVSRGPVPQSVEGSRPYYITFERLLPLTVFVNIKSITLDVPWGMNLNERELLNLASSWPHLEWLEVGERSYWTPSSGITPGGFLLLLERCRSLRVLYVAFNTRDYTDIPQGHPWRGLRMPKDACVHLLKSPIEEESIEALGVFFHVAPYPDFKLFTHWEKRYFRGGIENPVELCDLYYDRWERVQSLALNNWERRRDLRRSLEARSSEFLTVMDSNMTHH